MPSKIARKLTAAQTQRAIAKTKDHVLAQPSQVDDVQQAIANTQRVGLSQVSQDDVVQPDEETQLEHDLRQAIAESQRVRLSQTSQEDDDQPDQETQVDDDTQPDADDPTSSADSSIVDDAMASTADGADATTPDTPASSTHEVETKPATKKPAAKKVAGKKIPATDDKKDGEVTKKKRRVKRDPTNFSAYIHKGLSSHLMALLSVRRCLNHSLIVNKEVNPEGGMSKAAMQIMNDFIKGTQQLDLSLKTALITT